MKKIGKTFLPALWVCFLLCRICTAETSISASVDRTHVALNESFQVSVTISGGSNIPAPQLPDLSSFNVYSSGRSQNISFVNGQVSSSITHTYVLSPKSVGDFTIGAFSVTVDGKTVQTQPIKVQVVSAPSTPASPPSAAQQQPASQAPGAFVTLTLDRFKAYVNEQVLMTFRFYYRMNLLSQPEYRPPELAGFISEDLMPPRYFTESAHGVQYHVSEIKTAIFPTQPETVTIKPATLKIRVEDPAANPFADDFFRSFFRGAGREVLLRTDPVTLTVLALPSENRPQNFSGGVGEFGMSAGVDKTKMGVGDSLTLTVTISGTGNVKSMSDPVFPDFTGFRKYDTASSLNIDKSGGKIGGSKVYKVILVPQLSGVVNLPAVSFSYFHLPSKKYKTVTTQPITMSVSPAKSTGVVISPYAFATPAIEKMRQDIRYIQPVRHTGKSTNEFHRHRLFLPLNLVPVVGVLGAGFLRWRRSQLEKNPVRRRFYSAYGKATKELKKLRAEGIVKDPGSISSRMFKILQTYISDKMLVAEGELSLKEVQEYLERLHVAEDLVKRLCVMWNELEFAQYAPTQFRTLHSEKTEELLRDVLEKLDRDLNRAQLPLQVMGDKRTIGVKMLNIVVVVLLSELFVSAQTPDEKFKQADQYYQEGRFDLARMLYEEIRNSGERNFELEYNIGNTLYKSGRIGPSVAYWIRAWKMNPRDGDVRFNLSLATEKSGDPFFSNFFLYRWMKIGFYALNWNEITVLWLISLWLFSIWAIRTLLKREKILQQKNIIPIVFMALMMVWWELRFEMDYRMKYAVVSVTKAEVRSGPGNQFGVGFTIPEGRIVQLIGNHSNTEWIEVGIPKESIKGWVAADQLDKI